MDKINDGSHLFVGYVGDALNKVHNCFFCLKDSNNCQYFYLKEQENPSEELRMLYGQKFVVCPICEKKGIKHLVDVLVEWVQIQKILKTKNV